MDIITEKEMKHLQPQNIYDKYITFKDEEGRLLKTKIKTPEAKETTYRTYNERTYRNNTRRNTELRNYWRRSEQNEYIHDRRRCLSKFQYKLSKRINQQKGSSNHYILIYEKEMEIKIDTDERIITYLNQEIFQKNWKSIKEAIIKKEQPKVRNPLIQKK